MTVSALRKRSQEQGWTRKHQGRFDAEPPEVRWAPRPGQRLSRYEMTVEQFRHQWPEVWAAMEDMAGQAALEALCDTPENAAPFCEWAYRWRAEHLGPDCAAEDARLRAEREKRARP